MRQNRDLGVVCLGPSLAGSPSDAHLLRENHVCSRLCLRCEATEPTPLCSLHSETQAQPKASPGPVPTPGTTVSPGTWDIGLLATGYPRLSTPFT